MRLIEFESKGARFAIVPSQIIYLASEKDGTKCYIQLPDKQFFVADESFASFTMRVRTSL